MVAANLPTRYGNFQIIDFVNNDDQKDHIALVKGDVYGKLSVLVRIHFECLTADALESLRCDCHDQLSISMKKLASYPNGVLLYLRQQGRGIGLTNKIRAYQLQDFGYDTFEANKALGFADDKRDYRVGAHMLLTLNVRSVILLTNNPAKIHSLRRYGVKVTRRDPLLVNPTKYNRKYLTSKFEKSCHLLDDLFAGKRGNIRGEKRST